MRNLSMISFLALSTTLFSTAASAQVHGTITVSPTVYSENTTTVTASIIVETDDPAAFTTGLDKLRINNGPPIFLSPATCQTFSNTVWAMECTYTYTIDPSDLPHDIRFDVSYWGDDYSGNFVDYTMFGVVPYNGAPIISNVNVQNEYSYVGVNSWNTIEASVIDPQGGPYQYNWTETSSPKYLGVLPNSNLFHTFQPVNLPAGLNDHTIEVELVVQDSDGNNSVPKSVDIHVLADECEQLSPVEITDLFDLSMFKANSAFSVKIRDADFTQILSDYLLDLQSRNPALTEVFSWLYVEDLGNGPAPAASLGPVQGTSPSPFTGQYCWGGNFNCSISTPDIWQGDLFRVDHWYRINSYMNPMAPGGGTCGDRKETVTFRLPRVANWNAGQRPMEIYDGTTLLNVRQIDVGRRFSVDDFQPVTVSSVTDVPRAVDPVGEATDTDNPPLQGRSAVKTRVKARSGKKFGSK